MQVRVDDLVSRRRLAGQRRPVARLKTHQTPNPVATHPNALAPQAADHLPRAVDNAPVQSKIGSVARRRRRATVVPARSERATVGRQTVWNLLPLPETNPEPTAIEASLRPLSTLVCFTSGRGRLMSGRSRSPQPLDLRLSDVSGPLCWIWTNAGAVTGCRCVEPLPENAPDPARPVAGRATGGLIHGMRADAPLTRWRFREG